MSLEIVELKELVYHLSGLVFILDKNSLILDINDGVEKVSGFSKNELIGKKLNILDFKTKSGEDLIIDWDISNYGDYKLLIGKDISRQKELRKALEAKVAFEVKKRREQEQFFIEKSRLVSMAEMLSWISHHWRQPLNIISLITNTIKVEFLNGELSEESLSHWVNKIFEHIEALSNTINMFRDITKTNKEKEIFNVSLAIRDVIKIIYPSIEEDGIDLKFFCGDDNRALTIEEITDISLVNKNLESYGHESEFKHVILNLINNAIDFINMALNSGELKDIPTIHIKIKCEIDWIVITIFDNGKRIDDVTLNKIYEPYFTTKGVRKGIGLGLFISKIFIEQDMNGELNLRNVNNGVEAEIRVKHYAS